MNAVNTFWLDILRFTLLVAVLGYAAWSDHKTGEVANKVWIYAFFGLSLTFVSWVLNPQTIVYGLLGMGAATLISLSIFYLGGWGGADAKAFMTIGASLPVTPFLPFNIVFMYPLNVIWICSIISFTFVLIKKRGKITRLDTVRFLPYVSLAMFIALLI